MKTKERLLHTSTELFSSYGYCGTGLKKIVAESNVAWGSMYHFFPKGKKQLGIESVRYAGDLDNLAFQKVFDEIADPILAVRAIFSEEMRNVKASDFKSVCAVASVAIDVISSSESVNIACQEVFCQWEQTITEVFIKLGVKQADAETVASGLLSALEGATLLSCTYRSTKPLHNAMKMVEITVKDTLSKTIPSNQE